MSEFPLTIAGQAVAATDRFPVENPSNAEPFAHAPVCTPDQLDDAMRAATQVDNGWVADTEQRREALKACARVLLENLEQIATVLTTEQGKPLADSRREVGAAAAWFNYYASLDQPVQVVQDNEVARIEVHHKPFGVVAAITPWNFPILLASWKVAPALRAGNTLVLKPSPFTPLSSLLVGQLLADVLPAGVFSVISGPDSLGPALTNHPAVRKISFTGSTRTGKHVAEAAAKGLRHLTLELGGNDAAIVAEDVDPVDIAEKLFWAAFVNNGQACIAAKRLYVPNKRYADYVDALSAVADRAVVGDGAAASTQLGPLNNRMQFDRVSELVTEALAAGARLASNGGPTGEAGHFYRPAILANVPDNARIVTEEQFGPALPVLGYDSLDEAIARANESDFGLGGSVWTNDADLARKVADQLDCGTVWTNNHAVPTPLAPFSGTKDSGLGAENGPWGLESFTRLQTHHITRN